MKPIQEHKDPRITNISLDNFTGSIYILNSQSNDENQHQSMLTSPRSNVTDHFVPSHHLALITQPVLGARSRKRTTNILVESSTTKDQLESMSNSRRESYNDSPPLILPINRIDTSHYQKPKYNSNSHRESSDSGLDLSSSTTSSVQPYSQQQQQHIVIHRPLSALNEDTSPDDGYYDEQQEVQTATRLRFPPVHFGRNRSMEDILSTHKRDQQQQHRSGSFTDERQQKLPSRQDHKMKRSSDGALLDLVDIPIDSYRRANLIKTELLYPPSTTPHRSLNDLTNKTSNRVLPIRNESNMSTTTTMNNLLTTHTIIRKPNTSTTLKPLRKKTKLNIIIEPSVPLTSSRLAIYDEQINTMTGTTSGSSNQTTPRSSQPSIQLPQQQQQIKSKVTTPLGYYSNQEQMKAHVNRSVVERQHPPAPPRRGVIQQLIPFDASPSKVNKLLLRHHVQQQPTTIFHPRANMQLSPSRHGKQTSRTLHNDETFANLEDGRATVVEEDDDEEEKSKQMKIENFKEQQEKHRCKQNDEIENNQINEKHHQQISRRIKDIQEKNASDHTEQTIPQRYFLKTNPRSQDKELSFEKNPKKKLVRNRLITKNENLDERQQTENTFTSTPRHPYEISHVRDDHRQRRVPVNDSNRNATKERYGSGQSSSTTGKSQDSKNILRRQPRNVDFTHGTLQINRTEGVERKQRIHQSKSTELETRNRSNEKKLNRTTELNTQYGSDHLPSTQKSTFLGSPPRPPRIPFQSFDTSPTRNPILLTQIEPNRHVHSWQNSQHETDHHPKQRSVSKLARIQPISITNTHIYQFQREREISRLSNASKTESIPSKLQINDKTSTISFPSRSPTSWSVISEHQHDQQKLSAYQTETLPSASSHDELVDNQSRTSSRTYRLKVDDQESSSDGRHVIPSDNSQVSSLIDHTYPFTFTPDFESSENDVLDNFSLPKSKPIESNIYILSDRDDTQHTIDRQSSSSSSIHHHHSSKKKYYSPPPPPLPKVTISTENDEHRLNDESDDGWSDDSAELLYIDERYATEKRKITPSSHLSSQAHYHYQVQQPNMLLQ